MTAWATTLANFEFQYRGKKKGLAIITLFIRRVIILIIRRFLVMALKLPKQLLKT